MLFRFVILAAGKGTRMQTDIPKPLVPVMGKPIIHRLLDAVEASQVNGTPVLVVGHGREQIEASVGTRSTYVVQEDQLGTAHAVGVAKDAVGAADAVIVLYGDHPFIRPETLRTLAETHASSEGVLTMMTVKVPSFEGDYRVFEHWGRVLRDYDAHVIGIREDKDAMDSEREILEVNPAMYCFNATWLWENIREVKNYNAKGEYYLTDLVELAVSQGKRIATVLVAPEEAVGVNTKDELAVAEAFHAEK